MKKQGLTLVEILTVLAITVIMIGLIIPSSFVVRRFAKETKQRAQLTTMGLALTVFRNDYGEYPPSNIEFPSDYCGAQKLAEALVGWDLLGFHPASYWLANGRTSPVPGLGTEIYTTDEQNLRERKGSYLELGTANAFRLGDLYGPGNTGELNADTFVLCDAFGIKKVAVGNRKKKAGTPILYYQANLSSKIFDVGTDNSIYRHTDNQELCRLPMLANPSKGEHRLYNREYFYNEYLKDPKIVVPSLPFGWPYRPTSYILISAGHDGEYGTTDDITNFGD